MYAILCAVLAGLCWGVGEIYTKSAINTGEVGPMGAQLVRASVALPLALVSYLVFTQLLKTEPQSLVPMGQLEAQAAQVKHARLGLSGSTWLKLLIGSGLLAGFAGVFFFYLGLSLPGGEISKLRPIAFALAPATAVFLGYLVLGEPLTTRKIISVVLILVGIIMLAGEKHTPHSSETSTSTVEKAS